MATPKHFPGFGAVDADPHFALASTRPRPRGIRSARRPFPRRLRGRGTHGHVRPRGPAGGDPRAGPACDRLAPGHARAAARTPGLQRCVHHRCHGHEGGCWRGGQHRGPAAGVEGSCDADRAAQRRLEEGLRQAALGRLSPASGRPCLRTTSAAAAPLAQALRWAPRTKLREEPGAPRLRPPLARAAITLVRDRAACCRCACATPSGSPSSRPARELTPRGSSSPRQRAPGPGRGGAPHALTWPRCEQAEPDEADIVGAREAVAGAGLVIVATLATAVQLQRQARLVEAVLETGTPTVTVAMRTPYDLADYPASATRLCSYSIGPAVVGAVADALFARRRHWPAAWTFPAMPVDTVWRWSRWPAVEKIREQPEVAARLLAQAAVQVEALDYRHHSRLCPRYRRPRHLGPRRHLRPVRDGCHGRPVGGPGHTQRALALRRLARLQPCARHRHQPVGCLTRRARHPRGPSTRCTDAGDHQHARNRHG